MVRRVIPLALLPRQTRSLYGYKRLNTLASTSLRALCSTSGTRAMLVAQCEDGVRYVSTSERGHGARFADSVLRAFSFSEDTFISKSDIDSMNCSLSFASLRREHASDKGSRATAGAYWEGGGDESDSESCCCTDDEDSSNAASDDESGADDEQTQKKSFDYIEDRARRSKTLDTIALGVVKTAMVIAHLTDWTILVCIENAEFKRRLVATTQPFSQRLSFESVARFKTVAFTWGSDVFFATSDFSEPGEILTRASILERQRKHSRRGFPAYLGKINANMVDDVNSETKPVKKAARPREPDTPDESVTKRQRVVDTVNDSNPPDTPKIIEAAKALVELQSSSPPPPLLTTSWPRPNALAARSANPQHLPSMALRASCAHGLYGTVNSMRSIVWNTEVVPLISVAPLYLCDMALPDYNCLGRKLP